MSPESAKKNIGVLLHGGRKARMLHRREHAQNILKEVEGYIKNLTAVMEA